jgi:hypothetical protein
MSSHRFTSRFSVGSAAGWHVQVAAATNDGIAFL